MKRRSVRMWGRAWLLAACAGVCVASPALGQFARAVNPDRSVTAEDALLRVRELGEAGNTSEALRVLQQVLETDADRMLEVKDAADPGRFEPVRTACHRLLREWPELLTRYRAAEGENAKRQLQDGAHRAVERSRFMTEAGLEAALRVAQEDLEGGRFEAARLRLVECGEHPDAKGTLSKDRAQLAVEVAKQLGREEVRTWASGLAREAGVAEQGVWSVREAPARYALARTGLDAQPAIKDESIGPKALNSVSPSGDGLAEAIVELEAWNDEDQGDGSGATQDATESGMFAASVGGFVLINDGYTVACLDAATLGVRWRVVPPAASAAPGEELEDDWGQPVLGGVRAGEPIASVAASSGVVVASAGTLGNEMVAGARTLSGLDLSTGRVLWNLSAAQVDPALAGADFTGPVLIDGDVAIASVSRSGMMRRENELHLVGIDLFRGDVRWTRRVGSVGVQPWLRQEPRPEAPILDRGVVYRADDMGVLGAYEASTGRPLWVRQLSTARVDELQFRVGANAGLRSYQISSPVIDGDSVLCFDAIGNKILRLDGKTGKLLGSRDASAFGDVRYMLRVGNQLALVGDRHVAFVKSDSFEQSLVRMATRFGTAGIVGRCVASDGRLLAPVAGGVVSVDPANPDVPLKPPAPAKPELDTEEVPVADFATVRAGNPIVVELGGGVSALVVAERSLISTYLRWERAQQILIERATAEPDDPAPLLTMIELGSRAGRYDEIPGLADRVLAMADNDPLSPANAEARSRLFGLLATMTRKAQRLWQESQASGAVPPQLLARILGGMGRSAESPKELVTHAFAEAWLHEIRGESAAAIESYQAVLSDPALASVELESEDRTDPERDAAPVTSSGTAGPEAARRVLGALRQAGIAAYAGFEAEANRAVEDARDDVGALASVADRYPGSLAALKALSHACAVLDRAGGQGLDSLAIAARGLELSRAQANAAREDAWPMVGEFLGRVLREIEPKRPEAALRLVRSVEADRADLAVAWGTQSATASSIAATLAGRIASRPVVGGGPDVGSTLGQIAQPLEGWVLESAMIRSATLSSRESVLMTSTVNDQLALWMRDTTGTRFVPAWTRSTRTQVVTPILVTPEETVLLVRGRSEAEGQPRATLECVESATGRVRWTSQDVGEMLTTTDSLPRPRANERFGTPMDGQVRGSDLLAVATGQSCADACVWLIERDGAFAALRVRSGEVVAKGTSGITHVYDADAGASRVAIVGATYHPGETGMAARVEVIGMAGTAIGVIEEGAKEADKDGALRVELGDHVRFARFVANGDVLIGSAAGLALVGTAPGDEGGLVERWQQDEEAMRNLAGAWITPDGRTLATVDAQCQVRTIDPRTGSQTAQQPETASRVSLPMDVTAIRGINGAGDALAITSSNGVIVLGPDGAIIGADGITPKGSLASPALAARRAVCVEAFAGSRELGGEMTGRVRVAMVDLPFARVVSTASLVTPGEVSSVTVLDDTVLISAGDSTVMIDAPRETAR